MGSGNIITVENEREAMRPVRIKLKGYWLHYFPNFHAEC